MGCLIGSVQSCCFRDQHHVADQNGSRYVLILQCLCQVGTYSEFLCQAGVGNLLRAIHGTTGMEIKCLTFGGRKLGFVGHDIGTNLVERNVIEQPGKRMMAAVI